MQEDGQFLKCGLLVGTVCLYQYWCYQWIRGVSVDDGIGKITVGVGARKRFDIGSSNKILEIIGLETGDRVLFELRDVRIYFCLFGLK